MKKKLAICAIEKLENLYLREWVEYYYNMGIDNIILYDNNDLDGEYPHWVIGDYISNGFVKYENVRGKHRYQLDAYNDCYLKYNKDYEWIGFLDIDEFWYLNDSLRIKDFFNDERFPDCCGVFVNWLCYGDNDLLHYDGRKIQERFTVPTFPLDCKSNDWVMNDVKKAFVRTNDDVKIKFLDAGYPVYSFYDELKYRDLNFYLPDGSRYYSQLTYSFDITFIKHYRTLTIEEFLYRRFCRKGYADHASFHNKDFIMKLFWEQNTWTQEKQDIVDEFFNKFNVVDDRPIN